MGNPLASLPPLEFPRPPWWRLPLSGLAGYWMSSPPDLKTMKAKKKKKMTIPEKLKLGSHLLLPQKALANHLAGTISFLGAETGLPRRGAAKEGARCCSPWPPSPWLPVGTP